MLKRKKSFSTTSLFLESIMLGYSMDLEILEISQIGYVPINDFPTKQRLFFFFFLGKLNFVSSFVLSKIQIMQIKRGSIFSYSANVTIEGCVDPTKHGQYCDQTVENLEDKNYTRNICLVNKESKIYALNTFMPNQITVKANAIRYNQTRDSEEISITCHARANGIPDESFHDYSSDLSKSSMVIPVPEGDSWYFSIRNAKPEEGVEVCFTVKWEINYCPDGKDGPNCAWNEYYLEVCFFVPLFYFHVIYICVL